MSNLDRVLNAIAAEPWAITESALQQVIAIAERVNESPEAVSMRLGRALDNTRTVQLRGDTAVISITGPVFRYANVFTEISGATSIEMAALDFQQAVDNPAVRRIVLNVDSPGGMVAGVAEFANAIRAADKPVIAYAGDMAASAGYWLAAAADQIIVGPTAELGSVGTVMRVRHARDADALEIVSTQSPRKRPDPGTEEGRSQLQQRADAIAAVFIESVAGFRGVTADKVLADFGAGDLLIGAAAVRAGLADRIGSLESVIAERGSPSVPGSTTTQRHSDTTVTATKKEAPPMHPDPNAPLETRARQAWDSDPDLRAEFGADFERYIAYRRAAESGRARISAPASVGGRHEPD